MNYRNRDLLDLAYELDCTAQIDGAAKAARESRRIATNPSTAKAGR